MQGLLQYYISVAQNQYFDYIRDKIESIKLEPVEAIEEKDVVIVEDLADKEAQVDSTKINLFKVKLLEHSLLPEEELQRMYDPTS